MIDLYGMFSPNAVRIFIALEEFGLPYQVKPVDVFNGQQFDPEFRKLNPIAKVPVIVDHEGPDGKPYTVFESAAILLYLADKTGKLLPTGKANHFLITHHPQPRVPCQAPVNPRFEHVVHLLGRWPLVETRAGIEATDQANSLRKAPTH